MQSAPEELRVSKDRRTLTVTYAGNRTEALAAEMLRVMSPSAEVQGHSPEQKVTVAGKRDVRIADIVPVGHYAARIVFDDGHDSGLFTWAYLATLAKERDERWTSYLADLDRLELKRDR